MERKNKAWSLVASVYALTGLGSLWVAEHGWAAERIVRLKVPQNDTRQTLQTFEQWGLNVDSDAVEVINEEEGLVKVDLTEEEATLLKDQDLIESVTDNKAIYRPLVHYSFEEAAHQVDPQEFFPSFASVMGGLPEVLMPGPQKSGADPLTLSDWSLRKVFQPSVGRAIVHPSVVTAVIDTGIDYNHEDLTGILWRKTGKPTEVGYDFANNVNRPYDLVQFDLQGCLDDSMCANGYNQKKYLVNPGHGTHCAGHIAAMAGNSKGIQGTGAGTPLIGVKIFFDAGHRSAGSASDAAAIGGIDYAIKNGAKIISASWGGPSNRTDAERSELRAAFVRAQKAGVLMVVAAGNSAMDQDNVTTPVYPAAYDLDNMIVVAATDDKDKLGDFSNYGAKSVHIAAPGVKILSTTVGNQYSAIVAKAKTKTGREIVVDWNGTSMATPLVAGAAAAVWSKYPTLTYKQVRAKILSSARKVPSLTGKVLTGGVLNVQAALR